MLRRHPPRYRGIIVAVAVCAFITIADHVLLPRYVRGGGQSVVSHLNSLSTLLSTPGVLLIELPGLRTGRHTSIGIWVAMLALNFAFYTAAVPVLSMTTLISAVP